MSEKEANTVDETVEKKETKKKKDPVVKIKSSELEALKQEAGESKDKYMRLMAEFENARKRLEKERSDIIKYAHEEVVVDFLAILDDFERSFQAAKQKADEEVVKGIEMVMSQICEMLKRYDVKPIESVGKPFDPASQEALMHEETTEYDDGIVIEEYQKGFYLGDRIVRTAKVKVAKNSK